MLDAPTSNSMNFKMPIDKMCYCRSQLAKWNGKLFAHQLFYLTVRIRGWASTEFSFGAWTAVRYDEKCHTKDAARSYEFRTPDRVLFHTIDAHQFIGLRECEYTCTIHRCLSTSGEHMTLSFLYALRTLVIHSLAP